jgi:hypothetical protein
MRVRGYHAPLKAATTLSDICCRLSRNGFVPLLQTSRRWIATRLDTLGVTIPIGFYDKAELDVCVATEGKDAVLVRLRQGHSIPEARILDLLVVSEANARSIAKAAEESLGMQLLENSWDETILIRGLLEELGDLSPNGKRLRDPETRDAIRRLYDDSARKQQHAKDGAWLESLVADTLQERTSSVWAGQMIGEDEIDVLTVFGNAKIVIECKDSRLGQHDFRDALHKAQQLQARVLVFVATGYVHPNVRKTIQRIRERDKALEFHLVEGQETMKLEARLDAVLDLIEVQSVHRWITSNLSSQDSMNYLLSDYSVGVGDGVS